MSDLYEKILRLCKEKGVDVAQMCHDSCIPSSLLSDFKAGRVDSISTCNLAKIADYFCIALDELIGRKICPQAPDNSRLPPLNARDRRDIAKRLDTMLGQMENNADGLMFDGEPLDDESRELLRISLQNQLELSKRLAKQKYTPKKYRKPQDS